MSCWRLLGVTDDRGVSQSIATILMVAIVVLLSAVIGGFLADASSNLTDAPQATFAASYSDTPRGDGQTLNLTHQGGDTIQSARVHLTVDNAWSRDTANPDDNEGAVLASPRPSGAFSNGSLAASRGIRLNRTHFIEPNGDPIDGTDYLDLDTATVRIVWTAPGGGDQFILYKWAGPNA